MERAPDFLMIDLFCGAGGVTEGAEKSGVCKVIVAVNHDPLAIESHAANHSDILHFSEDILTVDTAPIVRCIQYWKSIYPKAKVILWASLECTNFSNAKGGMARDADSRTLAYGLFRYLDAYDFDYVQIENVKEFMSWGDLDSNGRPVSKLKGKEYIRWIKAVQAYGYNHDWRMLNAANFGGVTIRNRYFGCFYKPGLKFAWPQPTHGQKAAKGKMFADELKPWRGVREVLDFTDLGKSIFDRPKPLVDKSLRRILEGLKKFHDEPQIMYCNSPGFTAPIKMPIGSLTTANSKAMVTPMLASYYGATTSCRSVNDPAPTVTTKDRMAMVTPWIDRDFKQGRYSSIHQPAGALLTRPKMNLCSAWVYRDTIRGGYRGVDEPAATIVTEPKIHLCSAFLVPTSFGNGPRSVEQPAPTILASRRHVNFATAFIVNPAYHSNGSSVNKPCPTVVASQKSFPLSLAIGMHDVLPRWELCEGDSAVMIELKTFMRENGIADIFMRMLKIMELKRIQGFPDGYILKGPANEQKKFIGNSVETGVVVAWLQAIAA